MGAALRLMAGYVAGISIQVLNELELTLIFMLDFDMQVKKEEFALYRDSLRRGESRHASGRGGFGDAVRYRRAPRLVRGD
jgi:hypothetical protein